MGRVGSRPGGGTSHVSHVSHSSHSMSRPSVRSGSSHSMSTGRTSTPKPSVNTTPVRTGNSSGFGSSGSRIGTSPKPDAFEPKRQTVTRHEEPIRRETPPPRPVVHTRPAPPPPPHVPPLYTHPVYHSSRPTVVRETVVINNTGSSNNSGSYREPVREKPAYRDEASSYKRPSEPPRVPEVPKRNLKGLRTGMTVFFIVAVLCAVIAIMVSKSGVGSNTTNREKLDLGYGWTNDTCYDELDWIADEGRLNKNLKAFYELTGATPYVALVHEPEVSALGSDAEFEFADQWYSDNLPNEGYVLCMYFDSLNDYEDGNCQLVVGDQASILMDAEAQQVFWDYLDYYWGMDPEDISEDELFSQAFVKTGERIMQRRTETSDVLKWLFILLTVGFAIGGVVTFVILNNEQKAQRAAETERILSQPISNLDGAKDPLLEKYNK